MRDHTKLRAFELADALALDLYACTRAFPADERFALTLQVRRCAVSVASNIVEGCARSTEREYVQFLSIAYGSARELEYQLSLAQRLGYLTEREYHPVRSRTHETCLVLGSLIRSLRGAKRM